MDRRELFKIIALLSGGLVIGGDAFLSAYKLNATELNYFSAETINLLDEIGETIIPTTDTPGAKATKIGEFMKTIVTDCYSPEEQKVFTNGLMGFNKECTKFHGKKFLKCNASERKSFLISLEVEAKKHNKQIEERTGKKIDPESTEVPLHYYSMIKQLTIWGYFTSEIGSKQALRFLAIPRKYDGDYPYKKGDRAWAI